MKANKLLNIIDEVIGFKINQPITCIKDHKASDASTDSPDDVFISRGDKGRIVDVSRDEIVVSWYGDMKTFYDINRDKELIKCLAIKE